MCNEERKLVSVITGTYNRPNLINKCIGEVRKQTYPNIEHCIVSDGPDPLLRIWAKTGWNEAPYKEFADDVPIKFVETGRQWSQFLAFSISAVPFQVAQWLASGDYIMWLADDEEITAEHIEKLVDLLEKEDVDFVYSKSECWFNTKANLRFYAASNVIGESPPASGRITQALFRVELLDYRGFTTHVGSGTDWDQIKAWMDAGASWAFLEEVTHTHRVDKMGDRDLNQERQPLRGNLKKEELHVAP